MKLLIFGATGATGRKLVDHARAGHTVSVFVRNPELATFAPDVRIIQGDAFSPEAVAAAVPGHDAVLSCIGASLSKSFAGWLPGEALARPLVDAMQRSGVRRLVALSAMGAVDRSAVSPAFRFLIATVLRGIFADKDRMEPIISGSPLDWTIVRAANLNNRPEDEVDDAPPTPLGVTASVSRASVAAYMLRIVDQPATFRRVVFLKSR
jgi:uncharacterized protein YbjT (DUF2867 family)